jgi:hypothetical protein
MPYVPPHLRPGYIPTVIEKPDLTGRVHWPTNMNKTTNILESSKVHLPVLGIVAAKSALKLTKPIKLNSQPVVDPDMSLFRKPSKFNLAVRRHIKRHTVGSKKRKLSKHHRGSKKAKRTRSKTR